MPASISLLVVTHCHADHIGCLPELVANGDIVARWALVADESRRWSDDTRKYLDEAPEPARCAVTALLEEEYGAETDEETLDLLDRAKGLRPRYAGMLDTLAACPGGLVRY